MPVRFAYHAGSLLPGNADIRREDVLAACRTMAEIGWRGLEFSAGQAQKLWPDPADLGKDLADCGIRPVTLYTPYGVTHRGELEAACRRGRRAFAYLAAAGCEFALLDGGSIREGDDLDAATEVLAESAHLLAREARSEGIPAVWHQHYGTVIQHPEQFHRFMERLDPALVSFCPDTAQLALGGIDCPDTFRRYADRIAYVHFKDLDADRRMREPGGGMLDFVPLRDLLVKVEYSGWVSPDLDYTTGMTPEEAARRGLARLRELFGREG
jgi:inosose dehydratase